MNTSIISAAQYETARRRLQLDATEAALLELAARGALTEGQRWNLSAIQTIDYLVSDDLGSPPSFSAWLLAQINDSGIVGHLACRYEDLSTAWVGRTSAQVREHLVKIGRLDRATADALNEAEAEFMQRHAAETREPHALYRFFDRDGYLLYIGLTKNPGTRWPAHSKDKPWWTEVATITIEHYPTRAEVEAAEIAAIRAERPLYNVQHNRRDEARV